MNQLKMFETPSEVTDANLSDWIAEVGEHSPIGRLLVMLESQAPRGFLALLDYRADGVVRAEEASDLINNASDWIKELAAYNMAQLEAGE